VGNIWRNLLRRKTRTVLSVLGVAVSVAGIMALISVAQGLLGSFDAYMESSGATLLVFSRSAADLAFSSVAPEEVEGIEKLEGVASVSRSNFHMAMAPRIGGKRPAIPVIFCFGRFPEDEIMAKYRRLLVHGRLFEKPDEILAGRFVAATLGLKVGSKMPLFGRTFRVVGIYDSDIAWENGGVIVDAGVLAGQLGRKDSYSMLFVFTARKDRDGVRARIEKRFPDLVAVRPSEFTNRFAAQFRQIDDFVYLITLLALVVGILGVLNTMMMSVAERTREIGMLRALGWQRWRIMRLILAEGLLLSGLGGLVGLALGVFGTKGLIALFADAYLVARFSPTTFLWGGAVALGVGLGAATYPALHAANLRPVEALRYE